MWYWRRLLRVSWTARSNQSILKEINSAYSLEELMLKLKLEYFGHRFNGHELGQTPGDDLPSPRVWEAWHAAVHGVTKSQTQLRDWTTNKVNKWKNMYYALDPTLLLLIIDRVFETKSQNEPRQMVLQRLSESHLRSTTQTTGSYVLMQVRKQTLPVM